MSKRRFRIFLVPWLTVISALPLSASDEISVTTPQNLIPFVSDGVVHVPVKIVIENHRDNRWLRFDWGWGASEIQLNNPTEKEMESGEYERSFERKYLIFTDHDFQRRISQSLPNGLYLPVGEYEIVATLRRSGGKEFTAKVKITIGTTGLDDQDLRMRRQIR